MWLQWQTYQNLQGIVWWGLVGLGRGMALWYQYRYHLVEKRLNKAVQWLQQWGAKLQESLPTLSVSCSSPPQVRALCYTCALHAWHGLSVLWVPACLQLQEQRLPSLNSGASPRLPSSELISEWRILLRFAKISANKIRSVCQYPLWLVQLY